MAGVTKKAFKQGKSTSKKQTRKLAAPTASDSAPAANASTLLSMDEAIALLKTTRATFYRWLRAGKFEGHKAGRQWRFEKGEIERFLKGEAPRIELRTGPDPLLDDLRNKAKELHAPTAEGSWNETPLDEAIRLILEIGLAMRATDIHLATYLAEDGKSGTEGILRYRVDGVLHPVLNMDPRLVSPLLARWKQMAHLPPEANPPQDGRMLFNLDGGEKVDVRVSFVPTGLGMAVTARLLRRRVPKMGLDNLDFAPSDMDTLKKQITQPWGLIIVTGPTGCGKTTTLYSCLLHIANPQIKVMTVEDPIEIAFPWMQQSQTNDAEGTTFARMIRAMLRSDPDVMMVGEIRDTEVIHLCTQAALTGHMVFTTLHATDSTRAIKRILDMGVPAFLVGDSIRAIVSQRLIRLLCPKCSKVSTPDPTLLERARRVAKEGGLPIETLPNTFRQPVGCAHCNQLGYLGLTVIAEVLEITPAISAAVNRGASLEEILAIAVGQGMTTMAADGIRRAAAGTTTLDEVFRVIAT